MNCTRNRRLTIALAVGVVATAVSSLAAPPAAAADPPAVARVSVTSAGGQASLLASDDPSISADGTRIAFVSDATNLVAGDTNGDDDVFVHDTVTGTTTRVSVASDGTQGNNNSRLANISADAPAISSHFPSFESRLSSGWSSPQPRDSRTGRYAGVEP